MLQKCFYILYLLQEYLKTSTASSHNLRMRFLGSEKWWVHFKTFIVVLRSVQTSPTKRLETSKQMFCNVSLGILVVHKHA